MSAPGVMVRIPNDLVPKLDKLVVKARAKFGLNHGACEINRAFIHHLALRLGVKALEKDLG